MVSMRMRIVLVIMSIIAAAPASSFAQFPYPSTKPQPGSAIDAIFKTYDFPATTGLTHLCNQNVYPTGNPGWHIITVSKKT